MKFGLKIVEVLCVLAAIAVTGCTLTPPASRDADAAAKEFHTYPSAATVYVYRSAFNYNDLDSVLYVDGRLLGATLPGGYFRVHVTPGRHVLHGVGVDVGSIAIEARPGQAYFVALEVIAGHSNFRMVAPEIARDHVRACCALLENWGPYPRPLFR